MLLSASAISTTFKKASLTTAGVASMMALSTAGASAATISITDATLDLKNQLFFDGTFLASDTIELSVSGTVNSLPGVGSDAYTTNAAGIVTNPTVFGAVGTATARGFGPFSSGALLIGNSNQSTGALQQLFASNTANGLNSPNPPTTLSTGVVTLASIFGPDFVSTESLSFFIAPYFFDQEKFTTPSIISGVTSFASVPNVYTINGSISQAGATDVPEPFTIVGTLIGGTAALRMRKKLKADNN
jgi:hypothetical protein